MILVQYPQLVFRPYDPPYHDRWVVADCLECGGSVSGNAGREQELARWHAERCTSERWRKAIDAHGFARVPFYIRLYLAAGVEAQTPPVHEKRKELWVPAWAAKVGTARAPYRARLALLRRLARDAVAQQLLLSHPQTLAALLAAHHPGGRRGRRTEPGAA